MLLETNNLSKEFSRRPTQGRDAFYAVREVNLCVDTGDFVTISGKSGSGKTTLLTLLAGLAAPTSGQVFFQGSDLHALSDKNLSALRNREIGFVPQGTGLLGSLDIYDNVRAAQLFSRDTGQDSDRADFLLDAMGIYELAREYPASLSGGEMRRASIARALFNDPALLVADEPTGDLDPANTRAVMELLQKINAQGTTIILVTHEEDVAALGTRRFTMGAGRLEPVLPE